MDQIYNMKNMLFNQMSEKIFNNGQKNDNLFFIVIIKYIQVYPINSKIALELTLMLQ